MYRREIQSSLGSDSDTLLFVSLRLKFPVSRRFFFLSC